MHDFLFPASKLVVESKIKKSELWLLLVVYTVGCVNVAFDYEHKSSITPICNSMDSMTAAFKLLTALCSGCVENLRTLYGLLHSLFYTGMHCVCFVIL